MYMKTSIIWKMSDEEFKKLIKNSRTMSAVLRCFGMENKGNNYVTCKKRINDLNLDTSHFLNRIDSSILTRKMTYGEFIKNLTQKSTMRRASIKEYIIRFNIIKYQCSNCKNNGMWDNKKLSLQLEHKNGISDDNRIENLTFLCPNCHSQTDTFAGKHLKKIYFCKNCNEQTKGYSVSGNCVKCNGLKNRKVIRPPAEILKKEIDIMPMTAIGKKYGVSDNAVKRWCKSYNISLPKNRRGYWTGKLQNI